MMRRNQRGILANAAGFTLLELSIVVFIIAIVTGMAVQSGFSVIAASRQMATIKKMTAIADALMAFRTINDRIPCPADLTINRGSSNYGVEGATNGTCLGGTPAANFTANGAVEGAVPTASLGLSSDYMYDGWGNRIRYAVDLTMTQSAAFSVTNVAANCGAITVNDANGNARSSASLYALISHGANGHGAYTANGVALNAGSVNTNELTNCHCTSSGVAASYTPTYVQGKFYRNSANALDSFDDLVVYKERWQMAIFWENTTTSTYLGCAPDLAANYASGWYSWKRSGDTFSKVTDPATPHNGASNGYDIHYSSDNRYVVIADRSACDAYTVNTSTRPWSWTLLGAGTWSGGSYTDRCLWSGSGVYSDYHSDFSDPYLAVAAGAYSGSVAPYIRIWKRSGAVFTKLADPSTVPTTGATSANSDIDAITFSPSANFLFYQINGFSAMYRRTGDSFAAITSPTGLPAYGKLLGTAFSPDGSYFVAGDTTVSTSPFRLLIYRIVSNSFTAIPASPINVTGATAAYNARNIVFSPDSKYMAVGSYGGDGIYIYSVTTPGGIDTFTRLATPTGWTGGTYKKGYAFAWSPDSLYVAMCHFDGPYVDLFKRSSGSGDTAVFTYLGHPASDPGTNCFSAAFEN